MKSIFELERRCNTRELFTSFLKDVSASIVCTSNGASVKLSSYLEHCIRFWPYRCGAIGIDMYLKSIGVDMSSIKSDIEILSILELYINLLHWATKQDRNDLKTEMFTSLNKSDIDTESLRILLNIDYMLEKCFNMTVREVNQTNCFPQYRIYKRNAAVDTTVKKVPDLSDVLLSYLDIRNENDKKFKKGALIQLYNYMEPKRSVYKGLICGTISEEFFVSMNKLGIRHNTSDQIKIPYSKRIKVYDELFEMAIFVLQTQAVNDIKADLKKLRNP